MELVWWFVLAILALVIFLWLANVFAEIAEDKGYDGSRYFWLSLLFTVYGYLAVVALPDLETREIQRSILKSLQDNKADDTSDPSSARDFIPDSFWRCSECGTKNEKTRIACRNCGHYK